MPELPEVETLRRALIPLVQDKTLLKIKFFRRDLRFPMPRRILAAKVKGAVVRHLARRGKYLLFHVPGGAMIWHLGMSGRVTQRPSMEPVEKHTHAVFKFEPETYLHFIDPRRFGSILWAPENRGHPLLNHLGMDPFDRETTAGALKTSAHKSRAPIKSFLMNSRRLAGIGNIYACETLFAFPMNPKRPAGRLTLRDWQRLLDVLRATLSKSIASGGTTLRDFFNPDGSAGYFATHLAVYGKENQPCPNCGVPIARTVQCGRSTFFCKACQKK
ncbi:MAG: bifunctional DNA-formamidopyrimidine glycosylase/DNA-(apurinic or apyrimidinic site) lyase [Nitrospinales bacterium]